MDVNSLVFDHGKQQIIDDNDKIDEKLKVILKKEQKQ